ncbi:NAD-dependent protein deacetylase sirtuin-1 isoform 2-T2 [Clarias gariepinus]|uniref:NAD-dependent protein deacetylase sirtuin-1 isoform X2 n=1 Tax=Clarias gariepinus TaxID=13013 RepID=UPI00234E1490|nr:NAD-dependent protein deacetylase sirtuin-1 isoform X2 [Clarias gariepinus]
MVRAKELPEAFRKKIIAAHESGSMDDGISHNGYYSPDLGDDDDCSSHASSSDWTPQPRIGSYHFIQQQIMRETDPRSILNELLPETIIPPDLDDMTLWQIVINISEPPKRKKRKDINTIEDVIRLLNDCKKILVLTGAGVSVSCGIPDFRSRDGIYARLAVDFPDLPDPQAMFDIEYFQRDPRPFFKFAKEIYPGQFRPSLCHRFIAMLDKKEKLLRNYTQNIDTLEQVAGVQRVMQCHGSFATASCLVCKHKVDCDSIREDIFRQVVPHCPRCSNNPFAIMKPDIVFFGENLPEAFHRAMKQDKDDVDLLIVIGSSLKVRPVALIPSSVPHEVPQVLINREPLLHLNFDVELLGDCDVIVNELCHRLGGDFEQLCYNSSCLSEITDIPPPLPNILSEQECAKVQMSSEIQNAELVSQNCFTKKEEIVAETTEKVTDCGPNAHFTSDAGLNTPCTAKEAKPFSELENRSSSPNLLTQDGDACPCRESVDCHQSAPFEAVGHSPNTHQEIKGMEMLNMPTVEKHTKQRNCCLKRSCPSPISNRLGTSQYLFQVPNRYIFNGAEVYSCSEDETSSASDNEGSCFSCSGLEEQESDAEEECTPGDHPRPEEGDFEKTGDENNCMSSIHTDNIMENLDTQTA